jgi:type II secretory pathway component GspD/PulD (secretin)
MVLLHKIFLTDTNMQAANILNLTAAILAVGMLHAQTPVDPLIEAVPATSGESPALPTPPVNPPASETSVPTEAPATESATTQQVNPTTPPPFTPQEPAKQEMQKSSEGMDMENSPLNDVLLYLAKEAHRQYFNNSKIAGPDYLVTGHLNNDSPLTQMEDLALMYGLTLHTKGNTIYALTQAQLAQLPSAEFHYQLRYLRPTDIESIKTLIKPILSISGMVNFEPKTNTVIIIDSAHKIEQARDLLHGIDKAKGQIIVETKILRVNSTAAERTGVNWSGQLGKDGTNLTLDRDLNSIFGLPSGLNSSGTDNKVVPLDGMNLVLSPLTLKGVLRALAEGGLASQVSNPTLITEDNEQATISIIDRIPIITSTNSPATNGGAQTITEVVRYKIDAGDQTIDASPDKHREIGISMAITPTLLPDGTIRMNMRPRSAQVAEYIVSAQSKNKYPRVTESMLQTIARVPDGYSLVVGGFYGETQENGKTKVPLLGDLPVLNFFFKSKDLTQEKNSLVFIVTPKSYDPTKRNQVQDANNLVRGKISLKDNHDWVDQNNPGPAHEPNMKRSLRGLQPSQAPYYPRKDELGSEDSSSVTPSRSTTHPHFGRGGKH